MSPELLTALQDFVLANPLVLLNFSDAEWNRIKESNDGNGVHEFTFAKEHAAFHNIPFPSPCLIIGAGECRTDVYIGLMNSKSEITTLQTKIRVLRSNRIYPRTKGELFAITEKRTDTANFMKRVEESASIKPLDFTLSYGLFLALLNIPENDSALASLAAHLTSPTTFSSLRSLQLDAIHTAKGIYDRKGSAKARRVELSDNSDTSLLHAIPVFEDGVIEHDARQLLNYKLIESDVTGRALFENNGRAMEVFTANRRPLEKVFGVDLIYFNVSKKSIVMLQYKMLKNINSANSKNKDWVYYPDKNLEKEMARMNKFSGKREPQSDEFRLSSEVFYFKFIKKDADIKDGGIVLPLNHFNLLKETEKFQGPKGAFRVSYKNLDGGYLRHTAFIDLVASGYIGSGASTTKEFMAIVEAVLTSGRAVVGAIESKKPKIMSITV